MLTKELILKKIEENKDLIKQYGVKKIELFGSYAYGTQKNDSDIDFLVEFTQGRGLFRYYMDTLHLLKDLFNSKIDLVQSTDVREELKKYILDGKKYVAKI